MTAREIAQVIDHTLLKPEAGRSAIDQLCREAAEYGFASVCVNPYWVAPASAALQGTGVPVCSVIAFPFGVTPSAVKCKEAEQALTDGATEIDMVANLGALADEDWSFLAADIREVRAVTQGHTLKVILETALLTSNKIALVAELAAQQGVDFVKTSTGFHPSGGATIDAIRTMRKAVGPSVGVKASGGIRDLATVLAMLDAGATRIGASAGVSIVKGVAQT